MKKTLLISIYILTLFTSLHSQNNALSATEKSARGSQIVKDAQKAIGFEKIEVKSFRVKLKDIALVKDNPLPANSNSLKNITEMVNVTEINAIMPDKILSIFTMGGGIDSTSTKTWNGEKYKSISEFEMMGERIVKDNTKDEINPDRNNSFDVLEGRIDKDKLNALKNAKRQDPKEILLESMWTGLFPLILTHPFEQDVEFNYVGKAQANNITANVVDFKPRNGKNYRLLFDTETNYLLMMIVTFKRNDSFFVGDVEWKYYFSDRQTTNGVLIPRKIKVENKQTAAGKSPTFYYSNLDVLEFELNPKFKESMFEIK